MDFNALFNDWFNFSGFNPETDMDRCYSGNLLTYNYEWWELGRKIVKLMNDCNFPVLAYILLRKEAESAFTEKHWSVEDVLVTKSKEFSEFKTLYEKIYSEEGLEIENEFLETVSRMTAQKNLIGNLDRNTVLSAVPKVIEKAGKLNLHPLLSSGRPLEKVEIRNKIRVFSDMGELLINIEKSPEGLYLCYINPADSINGYFSIIYKSNGNIISIDDHLKESYPGQHKKMSQRNSSWVEDKAYAIFPYSHIIEFSKPDSKGYYTEYKLKGDFELNTLPVENLFPLCLTLLLVMRKYLNKSFDTKNIYYSTYLIGDKSKSLLENKALMIKPDSAVARCAEMKVSLTEKDIFGYTEVHGDYFPNNHFYDDHPAAVNRLISLWYDDKIKNSFPLVEDYSYVLNDPDFVENLLSEEELHNNARFLMRNTALSALQKHIDDYFAEHDFGNEAIKKWRELVLSKKELIFSKLKAENFHLKDKNGIIVGYGYEGSPEYFKGIFYPFNDMNNLRFAKRTFSKPEYLCDENGVCKYLWTFTPNDWIEACLFLEIDESELPKEIIGWTKAQNSVYGNPILSMCDNMESLQNGFMSIYDFYHGMCISPSEYMEKLFEEKTGKNKYCINDYLIYARQNPLGFSIAMSNKTYKKTFNTNNKE